MLTAEITKPAGALTRTIGSLFEAQAARTPDAVALVAGETHLTYRELDTRSNRLARYLQQAGVGPDAITGLAIERSHETSSPCWAF